MYRKGFWEVNWRTDKVAPCFRNYVERLSRFTVLNDRTENVTTYFGVEEEAKQEANMTQTGRKAECSSRTMDDFRQTTLQSFYTRDSKINTTASYFDKMPHIST
jgi:hypothetical protein